MTFYISALGLLGLRFLPELRQGTYDRPIFSTKGKIVPCTEIRLKPAFNPGTKLLTLKYSPIHYACRCRYNYLRNLHLNSLLAFSKFISAPTLLGVITLTQCEVAAADQVVMLHSGTTIMSVIWTGVYQTCGTNREPVDSDTKRVPLTRLLTFYPCGGVRHIYRPSKRISAAGCRRIITQNPLGLAVVISIR